MADLNDIRYRVWRGFLNVFKDIKVFKFPMFMVYQPTTFKIKGNHYYEVRNRIKPGDILLRGYVHYLDSYFIPGFFSHAAMYIGNRIHSREDGEYIIHAMSPCIQETDLCTFCRCDKLAVLRPPETVSQEEIDLAIEKAKEKLGTPYDFDFNFSDYKEMSCSELCYYCYEHVKDKVGFQTREQEFLFGFLKKELFAPDYIYYSKMEVVWQCPWASQSLNKTR